jgi:phosphatidylserine decarboxylase
MQLSFRERLNFLLTNRIPRRYATLFMGWFSKLENPLISKPSIALWEHFSKELDLSEAVKNEFKSLQDCFTRQIKPGSRTIDPDPHIVCSPCDAIIGAHGQIQNTELFQAKGFPYSLTDLLQQDDMIERYRYGCYVTLRLKASMYHRFHAPTDCHISAVEYISGDTWNVNPPAVKIIEKLYCKNERAIVDLKLKTAGAHLTLVPVAAILVAGIKLHCLPEVMDLRYRGPNHMSVSADYIKGDEMGYFQHGSTILLFANQAFRIMDQIQQGKRIRMGEPLLIQYQ